MQSEAKDRAAKANAGEDGERREGLFGSDLLGSDAWLRSASVGLDGDSSENRDLDMEKIKIEREMLSLERERNQAELRQLQQQREASGNPDALQVGVAVLGLAAGVALLVGAFVGYRVGYDDGFLNVPGPRKVLVSSRFLNLLAGTLPQRNKADHAAGFDMFEIYGRPSGAAAYGNFFIVR